MEKQELDIRAIVHAVRRHWWVLALTVILGLLAEAVSGQRFEDLARERVFAPLQGAVSGAVAPAHQLWFGWPLRHADPPLESLASGGWMASADQLARLIRHLGGRQA